MGLEQLKDAVEQIALSEEAKERILNLDGRHMQIRRQRSRMYKGLTAVCVTVALLVCMMFLPTADSPEWSVNAYAQGTDGAEWVRLKPGERVLLQKEEDKAYYMLKLDLPEHYWYEKDMIILGQDHIWTDGEEIYWLTDDFFYTDAEEQTGYKLPEVMSGYLYIKILDEDNQITDLIRLEVSKEYGKCYVQLKN